MNYTDKYLKYKLKYFNFKNNIKKGGCSTCKNNTDKYYINYCNNRELQIVAHRGAQGYLPEHTLESYDLAIRLGADYIELDIMSTSDGVLVAMHDIDLSKTTDIAERLEFAHRKEDKKKGWPINKFTLAEIKTLYCKQRSLYLNRSNRFNGIFRIPTLVEILSLIYNNKTSNKLPVGIYIELKKSKYFCKNKLILEYKLIDILQKYDLCFGKNAKYIYIQSFNSKTLQYINSIKTDIHLIQIFKSIPDDHTLTTIKKYAHGISLPKKYILKNNDDSILLPTDIVQKANSLGLVVHTWTVRDESVNTEYFGNTPKGTINEIIALYNNGINAVITDYPDRATRARDIITQKQYLLGICM